MIAMLGWHLNETPDDDHWEIETTDYILSPFLIGLPVLIIYALREGQLLTMRGVIDRYEDPLWFFIMTIGYGIGWLGMILAVFRI